MLRIKIVLIKVTVNESCVMRMALVVTLIKMFVNMLTFARKGLKGMDSGPWRKVMMLKKDFRIATISVPKLSH